jgi:hypothetical protein
MITALLSAAFRAGGVAARSDWRAQRVQTVPRRLTSRQRRAIVRAACPDDGPFKVALVANLWSVELDREHCRGYGAERARLEATEARLSLIRRA